MASFKRSLFLIVLFFTACSKVPPADEGVVSCIVSDRIGKQAEWRRCFCQDETIQINLQTLLNEELSADSAIQIALLNNPKIQVFFENLGLAQANLLEAGLLTNPSFEIEIRYPPHRKFHTNIEYLITTSLLDVFLIPLRTKLAETEFEQTKLMVSNEILQLAFDVRETYYELITEMQKLSFMQQILELTSIMQDLLTKQSLVGNVNQLELQHIQSQVLEAEIALEIENVKIICLREKFLRLLGFGEEVCLIFPESSLEPDEEIFALYSIEEVAIAERLDLQIARFEIARFCRMLGLKAWWTYTNLQGGIAGEREPEGNNFIGPGFAGEIPLFNYGQAERLRLMAHLKQEQERLAALEIQVRSEVREAHQLISRYSYILHEYQNQLLPMQDRISKTSLQFYNVMGLGVDKLLEHKLTELKTHLQYIENVGQYFIARVQLDRALGGNLSRLSGENL